MQKSFQLCVVKAFHHGSVNAVEQRTGFGHNAATLFGQRDAVASAVVRVCVLGNVAVGFQSFKRDGNGGGTDAQILCQLLLRGDAAMCQTHQEHMLRAVQTRLRCDSGFHGLAV